MPGSHGIQEMTYEIVGMLMLAIFAVSMLYPWHPSWPKARWLVHMPLVLLPLWAWYETLMPRTMNIRFDLLFIIGAMRLLFMVYVVRLILFWWLLSIARTKKQPNQQSAHRIEDTLTANKTPTNKTLNPSCRRRVFEMEAFSRQPG